MQDSSSFRLIVRRGPQPNQVYELNKGIVTLGRDITNDIVINDPEVSRHHCRLTQGAAGYTIEDLGSTNGTFVNGQRLTRPRLLAHNDMVGLGETVTLAYEGLAARMDAGQAQTMPGPAAAPLPPQQQAQFAPPGRYPTAPAEYQPPAVAPAEYPPAPEVYPQQVGPQPPMDYEYDYQDEPYREGAQRWIVLGCGCFLVLCIVSSVIGGIIIDGACLWDDLPIISDMFDLRVKPDANCWW